MEGYPHITCCSVSKDEKQKTTGFAVVPKDHSSNGCYNTSSLLGGNNYDVARPEYGRQILCEDLSFQLGCAEFDQDFQLHLFSEILPVNSSIHERSVVSGAYLFISVGYHVMWISLSLLQFNTLFTFF